MPTRTPSSLLISVLPSASRVPTESTSPSETARTWLEPLGMLVSIRISVMSSREEMTLSALDMCYSTSLRVLSHGRVSQAEPRKRSTRTSKRRRRRWPWNNCARTSHQSSQSSCTTAEVWVSLRTQTMTTSSSFSRVACRKTTSTWKHLTLFGTRTDWP